MNPTVAPSALVLRDIHLPGAPSLWPPAPGWWLLGGLVLSLVFWIIPLLLRRRRERLQRERLLSMFAALQSELASGPSPQQLARVGDLLKRLALARHPRSDVASLSGGAWLRFLDATGGDGGFSDGPGRVLADGPYRRRLAPDFDAAGFAALVTRWVERNATPETPDEDDEPVLGFVR
ncbi:MAG: DUF4381 domain-containing protein [Burkholderiaceae bacterium]|nr:DUF4381 domain-containing protein [Burkholderiaceae bacterium]